MNRIVLAVLATTLVAAIAGASAGTASVRKVKPPAYEIVDLGAGNFANAINKHGVVTGSSSLATGFLYADGELAAIGMAGYGINDRGTVAGARYDVFEHPVLLTDGSLQDLPGGVLDIGVAFDVNDRGQAAGRIFVDTPFGGREHAALWDQDGLHDLGTLGASFSWAAAINEKGQIVGTSALEDFGFSRAFLWEDGAMRDLGTLGGPGAQALDINKHGEIVGVANTAGGDAHPFVYRDGEMVDLGVLDGWNGQGAAHAINDKGDVVGVGSSPFDGHAFLYRDGTLSELNDLVAQGSGWDLVEATDINEKGAIVGWGWHEGAQHGFLARPIR